MVVRQPSKCELSITLLLADVQPSPWYHTAGHDRMIAVYSSRVVVGGGVGGFKETIKPVTFSSGVLLDGCQSVVTASEMFPSHSVFSVLLTQHRSAGR